MILLKAVSVMEKCFLDEKFEDKAAITAAEGLRGEECAFQLAYTSDCYDDYPRALCTLKVESPLGDAVNVRMVEHVPVRYPAQHNTDDYFLRKTPGFYPDLLLPLDPDSQIMVTYDMLKTLYITVNTPADLAGGDYPITFTLLRNGEAAAEVTVNFHCIGAALPAQTMSVTEWFHSDCIANYYNLETFSETHWEYIEKFIRTAVKNGINTILTPVFTPPLDTAVGHERRTIQLVDIIETAEGWQFGFEKLERWVKLCLKCGVQHFEISHLYSQWGAEHAPKIMGTDKTGVYRRLFGWETEATSEEYRSFLRAFLTELLAEMRTLGAEDMCYFHISDEPSLEQMASYRAAKAQVEDLLVGHRVMDALSHVEFYTEGVTTCPIPHTGAMMPFIEAGVPDQWTYYCCGVPAGASNRLLAMPMERTRVIGLQFWKYNITGFLQWGYNFYNSCGSIRPIDPYLINDGEYWVPAGDCFAVYPGPDGEPYETLHMKAFTLALQDVRALQLAATVATREELTAIVERYGYITFTHNPRGNGWLEKVRSAVNRLIEERIAQ